MDFERKTVNPVSCRELALFGHGESAPGLPLSGEERTCARAARRPLESGKPRLSDASLDPKIVPGRDLFFARRGAPPAALDRGRGLDQRASYPPSIANGTPRGTPLRRADRTAK